MTIRSDIEALASMVAKEAMLPGCTFQDRVEALKVLNTHYAALMKKKTPDEPDSEGSMQSLANLIHESDKTDGKVRTRSRN